MGKCNLLTPIKSNTGTLFTFSQYAEDLTTMMSNPDTYRVVISRFACIDLNKPKTPVEGTAESYSDYYGNIFQNYFENACSFFRDKEGKKLIENDNTDFVFKPEYTRALLFQTLNKFGMVNVSKSGTGVGKCDNIKFVNDINIISNSEHDNIIYNEFYCNIPQQDYAKEYSVATYDEDTIDSRPDIVAPYTSEFIVGFNDANYPATGLTNKVLGYTDNEDTSSGGSAYYSIYNENYFDIFTDDGSMLEVTDLNDVDKVHFNSIVIFYDVVRNDGMEQEIIHHNIPFGIYFTGKPESGVIDNGVNLFINNDDIYNQGSSYNLRVAQRFLSTQNATLILEDVEIDNKPIDDFSSLYNLMAESQRIMRDTNDYVRNIYSNLSNHLAMFKNNRINIPYIRKVGGVDYWFVNGRMLVPVTGIVINKYYNGGDGPDNPDNPDNPDLPDNPDIPDNPDVPNDPEIDNLLKWLSVDNPANSSPISWINVMPTSGDAETEHMWEDTTSNQI